jgi:translocation protein SEC72
VHELDVTNPGDALSFNIALREAADEDLQRELEAIVSLSKDLQRAKLEIPPAPQQPGNNARSGLLNQAREQGNALYKKGDYASALPKYHMAVQLASTRPLFENSIYPREELATNLSNRCAAHAALGNHIEALCDAGAITKIKTGWPKGYFRKGKALVALGAYQEAKDTYLVGLDFLPDEKASFPSRDGHC